MSYSGLSSSRVQQHADERPSNMANYLDGLTAAREELLAAGLPTDAVDKLIAEHRQASRHTPAMETR